MQITLSEGADSCACVIALTCGRAPRRVPEQLSFLSPIADAAPGDPVNPYEEDPEFDYYMRRFRKRRAKIIKASDVPNTVCGADARTILRTSTGGYLSPLFTRIESGRGAPELAPADAATILDSAEAILNWRVRPGVKIFRDPNLMLRFLRMRLVRQPQPIFAVFYLDRKQRLLRFVEMARGMGDRVDVRPKEVVRDALWWHAEQVLCVRSDPLGDHQPTVHDVEDARRVKRALDLLEMPLLDYVIVGSRSRRWCIGG